MNYALYSLPVWGASFFSTSPALTCLRAGLSFLILGGPAMTVVPLVTSCVSVTAEVLMVVVCEGEVVCLRVLGSNAEAAL